MLESDAKFEGKMTGGLKNDMKNLVNFHQSTQKSQIWVFYWVFLSKQKMYELKIYRKIMCHNKEEWSKIWRGIDLSVPNWHEKFDKFFTRTLKSLKNLHFNGLLMTKVYNFWAEKRVEELCLMPLNIGAKFEWKLTCAFKNDMRNLANFHQSTFESLKIGTLIGSFYPK